MIVDWIFFILSMKVLNLVLRWFLLNVKNEFFKGYDLICLFFNIVSWDEIILVNEINFVGIV